MYMFFWFFKQLYYCLRRIFKSGILLLIVFFIAFLFLVNSKVFASSIQPTFDIEQEISSTQANEQNNLVLFMLPHLLNNDNIYINNIKPILDLIVRENFDVYAGYGNYDDYSDFVYVLYHKNNSVRNFSSTYNSRFGGSYNIYYNEYSDIIREKITYNRGNYTYTNTSSYTPSINIPSFLIGFRSELFINFMEIYSGSSNNYSSLLNSINNYLDNISSVDTQILSNLQSIVTSLNSILQNSSIDYTQQISGITSKVDNIISSNEEIISQNDEMINQQEQINTNLENLNNTITDTNIDNSSINLPTDNSTDITQEGLNGIFTSIYNAFCVGQPQDIVFPIPFTNKNITLKPNYVRQMLTDSGANWVITIIQAFWWYLISRFIIKDITNKITKIKSGNIENIENSNIKGDML